MGCGRSGAGNGLKAPGSRARGIVVFGMITYRDARSNDSTFGKALGRSLRTAGKVLVALMP